MRVLYLSDDGLPDWRVEKSALTAKKNGHISLDIFLKLSPKKYNYNPYIT
jgi:predicted adenine nucleotide alpha hydrolase (AANH) superfamily ATPase